MTEPASWHGTTILTVRKGSQVAMAGDGQVSLGQTVIKANAKKVRKLGGGDIVAGFAGSTADAFTLLERLEAKLERHPGQLTRACVELAKDWRTDRYLRRLEAMMAVADREVSLVLTGTGDVLEPEDGLIGIGSGGSFALAAAKALHRRRWPLRRRDRAAGHEDRRRHLRLHQRERHARDSGTAMSALTPREIVSELDRFIVGQGEAKRAVAIALRNRWRRQQLDDTLRDEVLPKNILMIGPTGCGKTEIARRLARLAQAPFLKVEATKFTEVGYVGRDVESIVRDLVEVALKLSRERLRKEVAAQAELNAEERVLDALVGTSASKDTRDAFRRRLRDGQLADRVIELDVQESGAAGMPTFDIPGMPGAQMGMLNLSEMFGKAFGGRTKRKKLTVAQSYDVLLAEESDKLLDQEQVTREALSATEQNGIVFLDEIDKISAREGRMGADVSREGVQRDLLPLIEGTTVSTKYGAVKTDHILFIASGAFHLSKPSDLLPELQGRLPIRVELQPLGREDLARILVEPEASLVKQYTALMGTEGITLDLTEDAIAEIAKLAHEVNSRVENIGARRLQTVMEKLLEEVSFTASDRNGETVAVDAAYVRRQVADLAANADLSKFIL